MKKISQVVSVFSIIVFLLVIPSVSAISSQITIHTKNPMHGVIIRLEDPKTNNIIDSVYGYTDASGKAVTNYTTSLTTLNFVINVVKSGVVVAEKRVEDVVLTSELSFSFFDQPIVDPVVTAPQNQTESNETVETTNTTETETPATTTITGNVTAETSSLPQWIWYIVGVILLVGVAGFLVMRHVKANGMPFKSSNRSPKQPTQREILKNQKNAPSPTLSAELHDAQLKLKQAQEELNKISRVQEAEQKLQDAQRELERARRGF